MKESVVALSSAARKQIPANNFDECRREIPALTEPCTNVGTHLPLYSLLLTDDDQRRYKFPFSVFSREEEGSCCSVFHLE